MHTGTSLVSGFDSNDITCSAELVLAVQTEWTTSEQRLRTSWKPTEGATFRPAIFYQRLWHCGKPC